ncbi:MAG: DUF4124 domain-containing protein [Gammaproteobacteria bacterium]|nr:DUF4124 domain-containing protein [Gammaproteobacteria bacterium]
MSTLHKAGKIALFALWIPMLMGADVVYRWIDADGVVNFTQQLPRGVKAQEITTREGAPSVIRDVEEVTENTQRGQPKLSDQQQAMLDELRAAELVRQEEVTKIRAANCQQSREVLSNLSLTARIRVRDSDGVERVMGEDERLRRIEEAQQGIVINCNASS